MAVVQLCGTGSQALPTDAIAIHTLYVTFVVYSGSHPPPQCSR